jgi:hypothetical protein
VFYSLFFDFIILFFGLFYYFFFVDLCCVYTLNFVFFQGHYVELRNVDIKGYSAAGLRHSPGKNPVIIRLGEATTVEDFGLMRLPAKSLKCAQKDLSGFESLPGYVDNFKLCYEFDEAIRSIGVHFGMSHYIRFGFRVYRLLFSGQIPCIVFSVSQPMMDGLILFVGSQKFKTDVIFPAGALVRQGDELMIFRIESSGDCEFFYMLFGLPFNLVN